MSEDNLVIEQEDGQIGLEKNYQKMGKYERHQVKEQICLEENHHEVDGIQTRSHLLRPSKKKHGILINIFNEAVTYDGIQEEDIISRKESENRIFWFVILYLIGGLILATSMITLLFYSEILKPFLFQPNLNESLNSKGFPPYHVALISQDGSIYDVSLMENASPSKQCLMKLPTDDSYFGFSNPTEGLKLISSTLSRKITKYHPQFGHETIANSAPKDIYKPCNYAEQFRCIDFVFSEGIQVGNMFWVWGKIPTVRSELHQCLFQETYIYFWKRNKWIKGPVLMEGASQPWTSAAINATTAMMVLQIQGPKLSPMSSRVYNFEYEQWIKYPDILQIHHYSNAMVWETSMTMIVSKQKRIVYLACLMRNIYIEQEGYKLLLSYDLDIGPNGYWITEKIYDEKRCISEAYCSVNIVAIHGLLYSFENENPFESSGKVYVDGSWQKLNATVQIKPNSSAPFPIYTIPYYVRKI